MSYVYLIFFEIFVLWSFYNYGMTTTSIDNCILILQACHVCPTCTNWFLGRGVRIGMIGNFLDSQNDDNSQLFVQLDNNYQHILQTPGGRYKVFEIDIKWRWAKEQ